MPPAPVWLHVVVNNGPTRTSLMLPSADTACDDNGAAAAQIAAATSAMRLRTRQNASLHVSFAPKCADIRSVFIIFFLSLIRQLTWSTFANFAKSPLSYHIPHTGCNKKDLQYTKPRLRNTKPSANYRCAYQISGVTAAKIAKSTKALLTMRSLRLTIFHCQCNNTLSFPRSSVPFAFFALFAAKTRRVRPTAFLGQTECRVSIGWRGGVSI